MDGLQCTSQIRNWEAKGALRGHIPIIAVTANARSEQIATLLDAGMVRSAPISFNTVEG
jgi:CheY-like chemotaxis protein